MIQKIMIQIEDGRFVLIKATDINIQLHQDEENAGPWWLKASDKKRFTVTGTIVEAVETIYGTATINKDSRGQVLPSEGDLREAAPHPRKLLPDQ